MEPHVPEPEPKSGNQDEPVEAKTVAKLVNPALPPAILGDTAPLLGDVKPTAGGSASGHSTPGSKAVTGSIFSPGQMVAGRYRIVRFLAQGGMGEVYEVEDLELHEPAALKIVRPDIARDERMLERFIHEIRLARRVTVDAAGTASEVLTPDQLIAVEGGVVVFQISDRQMTATDEPNCAKKS